jgi:hypothetical protein
LLAEVDHLSGGIVDCGDVVGVEACRYQEMR